MEFFFSAEVLERFEKSIYDYLNFLLLLCKVVLTTTLCSTKEGLFWQDYFLLLLSDFFITLKGSRYGGFMSPDALLLWERREYMFVVVRERKYTLLLSSFIGCKKCRNAKSFTQKEISFSDTVAAKNVFRFDLDRLLSVNMRIYLRMVKLKQHKLVRIYVEIYTIPFALYLVWFKPIE